MSRKRWLALIAVAMLLTVFVVANTVQTMGNDSNVLSEIAQDWIQQPIEEGADVTGKIAVLELNGTIQDTGDTGLFAAAGYNHQTFLSQIEHAAEDPVVEGIIIRVDTPGGGVVESAEIYDRIVEAQQEYDKPVFISMGSMAASGGYYIAAPADRIIANPQTITGSIGVIMESINVSELAEKYGVKVNTIKSGEFKDIMSPTKEMTDEEREILQSIIDESYDEFVRIIVEGRGLSEEFVRQVADGRIYSGKQALELDLVDDIGSFDDTIAMMKEYLDADYPVVKYEAQGGIPSLFSMTLQELVKSDHELSILETFLSSDRSPTLKYLYTE
ncbi:signal peptide peptidase SppA [Bacillus suaedae]|uniref:Signal peptide peptidase SppA n=1 Tax=Halalkalibacter suaedae TaxID=2822140 RepID=A0A940WSB8_9BACI|nr:signal peptide peptidase SppA [Bacillus suaedae]MBP3949772.1 signal peptide peptidase SppA [Bacillus suaedae]